MNRTKSSKIIKESKINDLMASVNYEFSRRCSRSQELFNRLAEDLIIRYSPKQQPHPDFFKQDSDLALNQLTLYSDEYVEVMRKFEFLSNPATIISNLTGCTLRIVDFMSKKLYQYMKLEAPLPTSVLPCQNLCSACGKLRQNQKIRALRDQLTISSATWNPSERIRRDLVARTGDLYDVQELLQQEMDNFDSLNEQEIRKRLRNMELDHDRRKQEMLICIEELQKANERVIGYSKAIEKKKDTSGAKFDIKEYVFQLSRHFHHNLSSIDSRIKNLKQNLNPIESTAIQTDHAFMMVKSHEQIVEQLNKTLESTTKSLTEHKAWLTIEHNKCHEIEQMNHFFQEKCKQDQVSFEKERIERSIFQGRLNCIIAQRESKIEALEYIIKKLKSSCTFSNLTESELLQIGVKYKSVAVQCSDPEQLVMPSLTLVERLPSDRPNSIIHSKRGNKSSKLMNHNFLQKMIRQSICEDNTSGIGSSLINVMSGVSSSRRRPVKLAVVAVISQMVTPTSVSQDDGGHLKVKGNDRSDARSLTKQSKLELPQRKVHKLGTIRNRKSFIGLEHQLSPIQRDNINKYTFIKQNSDLPKFKEKVTTVYEKGQDPMVAALRVGGDNKVTTKLYRKKRRHFSQENSFEEIQGCESLEREIKEKRLFSELNQILNVSKSIQIEKKLQSKQAGVKGKAKGDLSKVALSLQQISYTTYFFSLLANIRLKNAIFYNNFKQYLCKLSGFVGNQEVGVKTTLKQMLIVHRKCCENGGICKHMETLLDKIKGV